MKSILLTGATGFLGSYLLETFVDEGFKVVILKRSSSNTWRIDHLLNSVVAIDIDNQPIQLAFEQQNIDVVVHTACEYGRGESSISDVVEVNLMFALKVLEASIDHNVKTFINTDTLLPDNINTYSLSKHHFKEWLKKSAGRIQCMNLRLEHIYGPKDDKTKFVFWLIEEMINSSGMIDLTSGEQKRDFIYIDDVVAAYMLVIKKASLYGCWSEFDVGSNALITMKEFVLRLQEIVECEKAIDVGGRLNFGAVPYRDREVMEPVINNIELANLGWEPCMSLEDGLVKIVKEYW